MVQLDFDEYVFINVYGWWLWRYTNHLARHIKSDTTSTIFSSIIPYKCETMQRVRGWSKPKLKPPLQNKNSVNVYRESEQEYFAYLNGWRYNVAWHRQIVTEVCQQVMKYQWNCHRHHYQANKTHHYQSSSE